MLYTDNDLELIPLLPHGFSRAVYQPFLSDAEVSELSQGPLPVQSPYATRLVSAPAGSAPGSTTSSTQSSPGANHGTNTGPDVFGAAFRLEMDRRAAAVPGRTIHIDIHSDEPETQGQGRAPHSANELRAPQTNHLSDSVAAAAATDKGRRRPGLAPRGRWSSSS